MIDYRQEKQLIKALRHIIQNDKTLYRPHEARIHDDLTPKEAGTDGTIWLTPREIAKNALRELGIEDIS